MLEKRLQRQGQNLTPRPHPKARAVLSTPVKQTDKLLRQAGITPKKARSVRKALLLHHSVLKEMKSVNTTVRSRMLKSAGKTCTMRLLARSIRISRKPSMRKEETQRRISAVLTKQHIQAFMKSSENSTCLPGKRDTVTVMGKKLQKYVLTENIRVLYRRYLQKNPGSNVSLACFKKARPANVLPVAYTKRQVCLCQTHQNFALRLVPLKELRVTQSTSDFVAEYTDEEAGQKIDKLQRDVVKFRVWRQVVAVHNGKEIKRTTLLDETEDKAVFRANFLSNLVIFRKHQQRVETQNDQFMLLKEQLQPGEATIQVDFAENYVCKFQQEVSGAYYSKSQVTIHPAVIHHRPAENGPLHHTTVTILSDVTSHKAQTIFAFLKALMEWMKTNLPPITQVHYLSDSPSSQYRNSTIFRIVHSHKELFQVSATWNYFESGHGKGPCDGVGGSVKRSADLAVKKNQELIKSAKDFFMWGRKQESAVTYLLVTPEEVTRAVEELEAMGKFPVPGTMKVHSVIPLGDELYSRETSCFSPCCWSGMSFHPQCEGWTRHIQLKEKHPFPTAEPTPQAEEDDDPAEPTPQVEATCPPDNPLPTATLPLPMPEPLDVGDFVLAWYSGELYVGRVLEVDGEIHVDFMVNTPKNPLTYQWPSQKDRLWMQRADILAKIDPPTPTGRSQRAFKLSEAAERKLQGFV